MIYTVIATLPGGDKVDVTISTDGVNDKVEFSASVAVGNGPWMPLPAELHVDSGEDEPCECTTGSLPIAGIFTADPRVSVQRCDLCGVFPGDLEAAYALAQAMGEKAWFYRGTGYKKTDKDESTHVLTEITSEVIDAPDGEYMIAYHTNPWIGDPA